jgi:hypothetical protein
MSDKFNLPKHYFTEDQIAEMMSPALAKQREQERKHKEFIINALRGDLEDNAGPYKLRSIVERDNWFVPLQEDGRFVIQNVKREEYPRHIAGIAKKDGRRTDRKGRGGQFIPIYKTAQEGNYARFDGRALARALPESNLGLLVEHTAGEPLEELDCEYLPRLRALADAIDVEQLFLSHAAVPTKPLLDYRFRVAMHNGKIYAHLGIASIASFEDKQFFPDECTVAEMSGRDIFKAIEREGAYGGIALNPGYGVDHGEVHAKKIVLSLHFIHRALRAGAVEFEVVQRIARSREEFEWWLNMNFFPEPREIIETERSGKVYIQAMVKHPENVSSACEWEMTHADGSLRTRECELRPAPGANDELAAGPSKILCPAQIARVLYAQLPEDCRKNFEWKPGRWLGFGRLLSERDIAQSQERVRLANELLKLIPEDCDRIRRETILTGEGAQFLYWAPFAAERQWAIHARDRARKYCKRWVFRG